MPMLATGSGYLELQQQLTQLRADADALRARSAQLEATVTDMRAALDRVARLALPGKAVTKTALRAALGSYA